MVIRFSVECFLNVWESDIGYNPETKEFRVVLDNSNRPLLEEGLDGLQEILVQLTTSTIILIIFTLNNKKMVGGGAAESCIYPIYGGIILLSGLIVGCTIIIIDGFKEVKTILLEKIKIVDDADDTID